jgi:hypothetical protein
MGKNNATITTNNINVTNLDKCDYVNIDSLRGYTGNYILTDTNGIDINLNEPVEFEDYMPSVAKIEDMCNDYPGLKRAYENFKSVYKMVQQDWQARQDNEDLHY